MKILKPNAPFIILFLLILTTPSICYSQDKELTGKVMFANTQEVLPYINISIPALGTGTMSNEAGLFVFKFSGNFNQGDSVVFSCIGFNTKAISIRDALKQKYLTISLTTSIQELKEVTIRPLTAKQLMDSISHHNQAAFVSPMKLNGYYREFAFTNDKCNEYSDALFEYHYDRFSKNGGQLKIVASRCEKAAKKNNGSQNFEAYVNSQANPDYMFHLAMLADMIKKHFSGNQTDDYKYDIEEDNSNKNMRVTFYPKPGSDKVYKLQFILSGDFTLIAYKLEIPAELLKNVKERSMLGIHGKVTHFIEETRYATNNSGIYPDYFSVAVAVKISGKFLGTVLNQTTEQKSEFVVTQIDTKNIKPFQKSELYKKDNICDNGLAMNAAMLKNYNFILPTKKDSLAISSINKDMSENK